MPVNQPSTLTQSGFGSLNHNTSYTLCPSHLK